MAMRFKQSKKKAKQVKRAHTGRNFLSSRIVAIKRVSFRHHYPEAVTRNYPVLWFPCETSQTKYYRRMLRAILGWQLIIGASCIIQMIESYIATSLIFNRPIAAI